MRKTLFILLLSFLSFSALADPLKVVIIGPEHRRGDNSYGDQAANDPFRMTGVDNYPVLTYDLADIKTHLEGLLNGSGNYQGSSVTVLNSASSLLDLHHDYYEPIQHPTASHFQYIADGYDDYYNLEDNDYDVAILINDSTILAMMPSSAFEGVLQMSKKLMARGTEVFLLEHDPQSFAHLVGADNMMKESTNAITNRIANGCGIHVVPAGTVLDELVSYRNDIDYVFSSAIYTTLTGEGVDSGNTYNASGITGAENSTIESVVSNVISSEKSTENYTGSFNGKGKVYHRPLEPTGGVNFAKFGTSTELGIQTSIQELVREHYKINGVQTVDSIAHDTPNPSDFGNSGAENYFIFDPELLDNSTQYLFSYYRDLVSDQSPLNLPVETAPQPDLLPLTYTRQESVLFGYETGAFSPRYYREGQSAADAHIRNGYMIPSLSIAGRVYDQYPDSIYMHDGHHQSAEHADTVAAGFLASSIGIDFDNDELDRSKFYHENSLYFMGWDLVMQQAYLSEDRQYTPDSDLTVTTASLPNATSNSPLALSLSASGGTAPYTWEEVTGTLPIGVSLHGDGTLSGAPTYGGAQTFNLVFKVTDANGAIRKKPLQLQATGYNLDAAYYGWDTGYYFDTVEKSDLISGTVIAALNGGSSNVTVDGITFSAHNLGGGSKAVYTGGIASTGDTSYDALLSTMSEGVGNEEIITLSGLTAGEAYTLQVFYNNKNDADGYASQMFVNIDGIGEIPLRGSNNGVDSADYGSYGVAHFIASGASVQLFLKARSDQHSIKGTAAFNALLLTQQPANTLHTGTTRHAPISWSSPTEVNGLLDLVEGNAIKGLNGGESDITLNSYGVTFESTSLGSDLDEPNNITQAYKNPAFADLMSEQSKTTRQASITFDNLIKGQEYQIQVFNKSKAISEYHHTQNYKGSDTFYGLKDQGEAHIFEDGKVMQAVGTFIAQSTSQVIELKSNGDNIFQDVSFSAMYLVESTEYERVVDDGTNRAPTIAEENGNSSQLIDFTAIDSRITSFIGSDPDAGDILRYSIISGNENESFRINEFTGELWYVGRLEGSSTGTYVVEVMVSDNKIPAKTATMEYTINPIVSDDTDGDGFSDATENVHGTNPFDASSQPFLLGYWDFNDPSDPNVAKGPLTSPEGSLDGGAAYTADGGGFSEQPGDYGLNLGTEDNDERMTITDLDIINTAAANDSISFSWWQYTTSLDSIGYALEMAGPDFNFAYINPRTSELSGIFIGDERIWYDAPILNEWTHYAITKDGSSVQLWINGRSQNIGSTPTAISETLTRIIFGARSTNGANSIRGIMDEFAIYNGPLTQAQVIDLTNGCSPLEFNTYLPYAISQNVILDGATASITLEGGTVDGTAVSYTIESQPAHGTLSGTAPDLIYTPLSSFTGSDAFTYTVTNGTEISEIATISITPPPVAISPVSPADGYHITSAEASAFRSTGVTKAYDLDEDNAYGTSGYFVFGTGSGDVGDFSDHSADLPAWVTAIEQGADFHSKRGFGAYTDHDDPTAAIASTVSNWTASSHGRTSGEGTGDWTEVLTFTLNSGVPENFRLGVLAGNSSNDNYNPSGIRVSNNGRYIGEVTGIDNTALGMVFFNIEISDFDAVDGIFSVEVQHASGTISAITGLTFDVASDATGYDAWIANYMGVTDIDFTDDTDGDNVPNVLEYVLGADPTVSDDTAFPQHTIHADGGATITLDYNTLSSEDTNFYLEYSTSLLSSEWTQIQISDLPGVEVNYGTEANGMAPITITLPEAYEEDQRLFWRFLITEK